MPRIIFLILVLAGALVGAKAYACYNIPDPKLDEILDKAFFIGKVRVLEKGDPTFGNSARQYIPFKIELLDSYKGPVDIVLEVRQGTGGCNKSVPEVGSVYEDVIFKDKEYYTSIDQAISNIHTDDWQELRRKRKPGRGYKLFERECQDNSGRLQYVAGKAFSSFVECVTSRD